MLAPLARLEAEGFLLRGRFDPAHEAGAEEFCERRLLARIHRYTTDRLRREIEPVTAQDLVRFLLRWQHVAPDTQLEGRQGLLAAIEQLQGFEIAAGAWEPSVLPARVRGYRPEWLDELCLSGQVAWARLAVRSAAGRRARRSAGAGRPDAVARDARQLPRAREPPVAPGAARGDAAPDAARPRPDARRAGVPADAGRSVLPRSRPRPRAGCGVEVTEALWDLVARGLVTADGFGSVRALFSARHDGRGAPRGPAPGERLRRSGARARRRRRPLGARAAATRRRRRRRGDARRGRGRAAPRALGGRVPGSGRPRDARRPWREVLWAFRRLEARGTIRGGRFVTGFVGEQYALPEAVEGLRETRRRERTGEIVRVAAVDPLNLVGS